MVAIPFLQLWAASSSFLSSSLSNSAQPEVTLDQTTLIGDYNATSGVETFLGVRYANANRFERSVLVDYGKKESVDATVHAPSCAQINNAVRRSVLIRLFVLTMEKDRT